MEVREEVRVLVEPRRLLVAILILGLSATAGAQVPTPTIEGPITSPGSPFLPSSTSFNLAQVGYAQAEYFISGTASALCARRRAAAIGRCVSRESVPKPLGPRRS